MEYIHEMVVDICYHLLNNEYTYDKIKTTNNININEQNTFLFQESQNFFRYRKFYFNFLLQISLGCPISDSTLFLSFAIFDRFLCSSFVNYDDFLLIIITSFVLVLSLSGNLWFWPGDGGKNKPRRGCVPRLTHRLSYQYFSFSRVMPSMRRSKQGAER